VVRQQAAQDVVVNRGKELDHVALQDVRIAPGKVRAAVERGVSPLPYPAGVGIVNEPLFPNRFDDVAEGVVDDAVAERRGADPARLTIIDMEMAVAAGALGLVLQLLLQAQQLQVEVHFKGGDVGFVTFAAPRPLEGVFEIAEAVDLAVEVLIRFHGCVVGRVAKPSYI
jgi:hypothetical protein